MRELIVVFAELLKASEVTETEMSWSLKIDISLMKDFLEGKIKPNMEQENVMFRFIWKEKRRIPTRMKAVGPDGKSYGISIDAIDPLI